MQVASLLPIYQIGGDQPLPPVWRTPIWYPVSRARRAGDSVNNPRDRHPHRPSQPAELRPAGHQEQRERGRTTDGTDTAKEHSFHLRELVGRLCQAELRNAGLPVSAVRWGGAHTAPDGGLDVDCRVEAEDFRGDFVPRRFTGFQVKKPAMPPGRIIDEMSPHGALRPIFSDLAAANGCYIIVSLDDDPTGEQLRPRLNAMDAQLKPVCALGDLQSQFYGRAELANWLRQHPAVQLWVRDILGIPLHGWQPYGRWTATPPGENDELICEPGISVLLPGHENEPLDIERGIVAIRELVRESDKSVRIVGLSGVGKSRLVQALFEDSVDDAPLDRNLAIYADLGIEPNPSPRQLLDRLAIEKRPAILVLDNCPTATHNLLAAEVSAATDIHLITVEYDIREDKPEETAVVQILARGLDVAESLVLRRHPELGRVNARIVAEFSGGNARLALVLADAVGDQESLSDFSHAQLFERLFFQRGDRDDELLAAAEALALVYSYSVEPDEGGVDELGTLAALAGLSRLALYRATQTLVDRQLVQKRARWRAVLPPAVSNRLAARALRNIPAEHIRHKFDSLADPRLLKSFGRRLGYLHDHEIVQGMVRTWLSPGGELHDIEVLDDDRIQLLANIAPVAPDALLDAIEARSRHTGPDYFLEERNPRALDVAGLLSAIAYDPALFERSIVLLAQFALAEVQSGQDQGDMRNRLCSLFSICLSGTEAGPDARERIARQFLFSDDPRARHLGLGMLESALNSGPWLSFGTHEFGARPRSFGYQPSTFDEQNHWFKRFLALALEIATRENGSQSDLARRLIAKQYRNLWRHPALRSELSALARALNERSPWIEGWKAVRAIQHHDYRAHKHAHEAHGLDLLNELDELLKPKSLIDEIRTYVLTPVHLQFRLDDEFDFDDPDRISASRERAVARAFDLGERVAGDPDIISDLSSELFRPVGSYLLAFGKGMASSCPDPQALWTSVLQHLERAGDTARHCDLLQGILEGIHQRDASLAEQILDDAVQTRSLRTFFVWLQLSIPLNPKAVQRLLDSLDFDDTPLFQFRQIAWPHPPAVLDESDLARVLLQLLDRPDGPETVLDGLNMRAPVPETDPGFSFGKDLSRVGLRAASRYLRSYDGHGAADTDNSIRRVLNCSSNDASLAPEINELLQAFFVAIRTSYGYIGDLEETAQALIAKAPHTFLDKVFLGNELSEAERASLFAERHWEGNVLSALDASILLDWCSQGEFQERLALVSESIYPFTTTSGNADIEFSDQAIALLDASPDASETLTRFAHCVRPSGWSGSLANIIARRRRPFELLLEHERKDVRAAVEKLIPRIREAEHREQERERIEDQNRDQRFE